MKWKCALAGAWILGALVGPLGAVDAVAAGPTSTPAATNPPTTTPPATTPPVSTPTGVQGCC